ncbi:MAG: HU family DNA-binding protein [Akkermansia sp.]|nr:HU family DNA-binding protein [Akkermansia sp.]
MTTTGWMRCGKLSETYEDGITIAYGYNSAQQDNGCTQADVPEIAQKMVDSITKAVSNGDTMVFRNFGTFCPKEVKAKVAKNQKDAVPSFPSKNVLPHKKRTHPLWGIRTHSFLR